jgi:hypothetical protein
VGLGSGGEVEEEEKREREKGAAEFKFQPNNSVAHVHLVSHRIFFRNFNFCRKNS